MFRSRTPLLCLVLTAAAGASGCRVSLPQQEIPAATNAELMEHIAEMPFVTADAAYRALHILTENEVFDGDFESLKTTMASQDAPADIAANECPDRGELARAIVAVCQVPRGLNYTLTGLGRYALRDLQYHRIVRTPNDYGPFSGGEFLGVLARAEEYMRRQKSIEGVELGAEPGP